MEKFRNALKLQNSLESLSDLIPTDLKPLNSHERGGLRQATPKQALTAPKYTKIYPIGTNSRTIAEVLPDVGENEQFAPTYKSSSLSSLN